MEAEFHSECYATPKGSPTISQFLVSVRQTFGRDKLTDIAGYILDLCRALPLPDDRVTLSCCVGIALYPNDGNDATTLIESSSVACRHAKSEGQGQYRMFNREFGASLQESQRLLTDLNAAVQSASFQLVYQPQYAVVGEDIRGVEVLLRWNHPERGTVSPGQFIPLAEQHGHIHRLTRFVIKQAISELESCSLLGTEVTRVSINLSAKTFDSAQQLEELIAFLRDHEEVCRLLVFEITETEVMRNLDSTLEGIERLRELGIRFSMDDFGTGYSSLNMLKKLPLEEIKIDHSFIRDIPADAHDVSIVRTIIAMAGALKMRLVAEGVETDAHLAFLKENGCDEMQGYLRSPPKPIHGLREVFAGR